MVMVNSIKCIFPDLMIAFYLPILFGVPPSATGQSIRYDFSNCSSSVKQILGASVTSQHGSYYTQPSLYCVATFKLINPEMRFHVQIVLLDLAPAVKDKCMDNVTLWQTETGTLDSAATILAGPLCGSDSRVNTSASIYATSGHHITMVWRTGAVVSSTHHGFHFILTAVEESPEVCSSRNYLQCSSLSYCIPASLVCDGVENCEDQSDEVNCSTVTYPGLVEVPGKTLPLSTHDMVIKPTTKTYVSVPTEKSGEQVFQEVDMVSIIVVGVLFVVILMICIILACRSKSAEIDTLNEESNQLHLDVSTRAGYSSSDGMPSTPPPTYSMIERQTSYVSQISMSSSQVSVPPDYEEALQLDSSGNPLPRRNSTLSSGRHPSTRSTVQPPVRSASGRTRNRSWFNRYTRSQSDSSRARYLSQTSTISEVGPIDENDVIEADDIFIQSDASPETPEGADGPSVTSTPNPLGYDIETQREDSLAPLFHLSSSDQLGNENTTTEQDGFMDLSQVDGSKPREDGEDYAADDNDNRNHQDSTC